MSQAIVAEALWRVAWWALHSRRGRPADRDFHGAAGGADLARPAPPAAGV
jgi:hypothetical protein